MENCTFRRKIVSTLKNIQPCILLNRFFNQYPIIIPIPSSDSEENAINLMWQLKVNDPRQSTDWKVLREFGGDEYKAYQELVEELNQINAPVQLRIEGKSK